MKPNSNVYAEAEMGVELPEAERWREESKQDVEFRKKWYAEHVSLSHFDDGDDDEEDEHWDEEDDDYDEPLPPLDTAVHEKQKIGRNDPCPCGSGKKYNKCCLKKEDGAGLFK